VLCTWMIKQKDIPVKQKERRCFCAVCGALKTLAVAAINFKMVTQWEEAPVEQES